jgi:hypothetical protein
MAIRFSILPPPRGIDSLNVPLIPDLEELLKFSEGSINISENIKKNFIYKSIQSANFSTPESIQIFGNLSNINTDNLEKYNNGDRYNIPVEGIELEESPLMGLKSLEKVALKTIFETQKPYMEFIPKAIKTLSSLEDISCRVLGLANRSLKPQFNERSLTYKLNESTEKLDNLQNLGKDRNNPFGDLSTEDKKKGVNLSSLKDRDERSETSSLNDFNFEWEIISTEYSTGNFIEGVDYKTIYRNIVENPTTLDSTNNDIPPIQEDEKPPSIVFAYYDNNGNETAPPTQWLDRVYDDWFAGPTETKWYGTWEQLEDTDSGKYTNYLRDIIGDRLFKKTGSRNPTLINRIFSVVQEKVDPSSFVSEANDSAFLNRISQTNNDGFGLGNDSPVDVNRVTNNRKKMFLPRKINFKGKEVSIDPEADYKLQIIKLVPTEDVWDSSGERDVNNNNLKRTTPFVSNYRGSDVSEYLEPSQFTYKSLPKVDPARVQTIPKYKYEGERVSYMIEGILSDNPKNTEGLSGNDDDRWYGKSAIFGAVKEFIDAIINIFVELLPEIDNLITLFKSPHEFIFDTMFEKIEKDFEAFSKGLLSKFQSLSNFDDKFERADFIKNDPDLKKYVSLDEDLNYRFILDGFSGMELLGFSFGININNFIPRLVLERSGEFSLKNTKQSINPNFLPTGNRQNSFDNGVSRSGDNVEANKRTQNPDGSFSWETVSTEYSTGDFIQGIDYEYIYITEDVERLLSKGDELFEQAVKSNDRDAALDSLTEYNLALEKSPNNELIEDKIAELKNKFKMELNMILQLLINVVSLPIKIVFSILEEFKTLFTDLAKIKEIPSKLEEFLSFKWILKYVKPDYILDLIGLSFNPELLFTWLDKIKSNNIDPDFKFDLSKIVGAPFLFKLPTVTKEQLEIMKTKPLELMTSVFKLLEELIEGILCFIWNILNLDTIIPCPKFPLSKFASANLPPEKLAEILNGESDPLNDDDTSFKFVYDIKLPDGEVVKGLNYAELQNFIKTNQDFNYEIL